MFPQQSNIFRSLLMLKRGKKKKKKKEEGKETKNIDL
jgi:hypothetical protein